MTPAEDGKCPCDSDMYVTGDCPIHDTKKVLMDEWEWAAAVTEAYSEGYLDGCGDVAIIARDFSSGVDPLNKPHRLLIVHHTEET